MATKQTTRLYKGRNGWRCNTTIPLPEIAPNMVLDITTSKANAGLSTTASVAKVEGGFSTFVMYQDYFSTVARSQARCTERNVSLLHEEAMAQLPTILAEVEAHYAEDTDEAIRVAEQGQ